METQKKQIAEFAAQQRQSLEQQALLIKELGSAVEGHIIKQAEETLAAQTTCEQVRECWR